MSSSSNTAATRTVYVPPAKRVLARLSAFRAPSTLLTPPSPVAPAAAAPPALGVASFPIPACRKKTPLTRTLSAHSLLERQEEQEEAQVLTAIRVDAENPLWTVPLLDRAELKAESAAAARAPSPSPLFEAQALPQEQFPTEKRRISIVTDLPTFTPPRRTARYLTPASASASTDLSDSDVLDISRPSSRASSRSDASSLFSAVSRSTAASSLFSSPISPAKSLVGGRVSPGSAVASDSEPETDSGSEDSDEEQGEVFVDTARKVLTPYLYAGGKTNVLGGGVMLGSPSKLAPTKAKAPSASGDRRSALFSALQGRLRTRA